MAVSASTRNAKRARSPAPRPAKKSKVTNGKNGVSTSPAASEKSKSVESKSKPFMDAIRGRRSLYSLDKNSPISDPEIEDLVKEAILHTPSTFNTQSSRLVLLLHKDHEQFWAFVKEVLKPLTPPESYPRTCKKMDNFAAAYGTILFYEDQDTVKKAEESFSLYAERFQPWSQQTSAMHQLVLWTALEAEGFGANLQHYNPVVDESAAKEWDIPSNWTLNAQIVFGGKVEGQGPAEKTFKPVEGERLRVHAKK